MVVVEAEEEEEVPFLGRPATEFGCFSREGRPFCSGPSSLVLVRAVALLQSFGAQAVIECLLQF